MVSVRKIKAGNIHDLRHSVHHTVIILIRSHRTYHFGSSHIHLLNSSKHCIKRSILSCATNFVQTHLLSVIPYIENIPPLPLMQKKEEKHNIGKRQNNGELLAGASAYRKKIKIQ